MKIKLMMFVSLSEVRNPDIKVMLRDGHLPDSLSI